MEGAYAQPQFMGSSSYYYYPSEQPSDARQHGHFAYAAQVQHAQEMQIYQSNMNYQRPVSAQSQYPQTPVYSQQTMLTPVASPQPICQKPTILVNQDSPFLFPLDTDCHAPSTPPLSSSGSSASSPPSSRDFLPTPVNGYFSEEKLEGVKKGCEEEVFSGILASSWSPAASPPMTPGKSYPPLYCGHPEESSLDDY